MPPPVDVQPYGWSYVCRLASSIQDVAKWHIPPGQTQQGFDWEVLAAMMGAHIAIESNLQERAGRRFLGDIIEGLRGNDSSTGIANITSGQAMDVFNDPCISLKYRGFYIAYLNQRPLPYFDPPHFDGASGTTQPLPPRGIFHQLLQTDLYTLDFLAGRFLQAIREVSSNPRKPSVFLVSNYLQWGAKNLAQLQDAYNRSGENSGGGHGIRVVRAFKTAARLIGVRASLPTGIEFYSSFSWNNDTIRFPDSKDPNAKPRPVSEEEYKNWLEPQMWFLPSDA